MFNAYIQRIAESETIVVNMYKGGAMLLMMLYLLQMRKLNKIIYIFFILLFLYFLCFSYWMARGYIDSFIGELKYGLKMFIYPYFLLLFLLTLRRNIKSETLINYIIIYACLFPFSIIVNLFSGKSLGYYAGNAFSIAGLVTSGNDFGLTMLLTNCLACYMFYHTAKKRYALASLVIAVMTMLLGSVAGIFGSVIVMFCFTVHTLFVKKIFLKTWQKIYIALLVLAGVPLIIGAVYFFISFSTFTAEKFSIDRLLSGGARNWLKEAALRNLAAYTMTDHLFGRGVNTAWAFIGQETDFGRPHPIEIDQYEMISNYGFVLGGVLLALPLLFMAKLVIRFLKRKNSFYFWASLAMLMLVVHGFTAGHSFVSIIVLQTAAVIYFCSDSIGRGGTIQSA